MNNSEFTPGTFERTMVDMVYFILGIAVLSFNVCVVVTMWQHENLLAPMRRICFVQGIIFIMLGFLTIHESFTSIISHHQTNRALCHFRVISNIFLEIMMQWCTVLMVLCSLALTHPTDPSLQLFVSGKLLVTVVLATTGLAGVATYLVVRNGTVEASTSCVENISYSPAIFAGAEGLSFFLTASLCCACVCRRCRGARPVSPDVSNEPVRDKDFSRASDTLLIYGAVFALCSTPIVISDVHVAVDSTLTASWYRLAVAAKILQMLSMVALFPICLFRHQPVRENFHNIICVKCLKFHEVFEEDLPDSYSRASIMRETLADPRRRSTIHAYLWSQEQKRMSTTGMDQRPSLQRVHADQAAGSSVDRKESPSVVRDVKP